MSEYKPPSDYDELTAESAAIHLLQCVDHWNRANTVEDKQKWEAQLARLMRVLLSRTDR